MTLHSTRGGAKLLVMLILSLIVVGALTFLKDEQGRSYLDRIIDYYPAQKVKIDSAVNDYKKAAENHSNEILDVEVQMKGGR